MHQPVRRKSEAFTTQRRWEPQPIIAAACVGPRGGLRRVDLAPRTPEELKPESAQARPYRESRANGCFPLGSPRFGGKFSCSSYFIILGAFVSLWSSSRGFPFFAVNDYRKPMQRSAQAAPWLALSRTHTPAKLHSVRRGGSCWKYRCLLFPQFGTLLQGMDARLRPSPGKFRSAKHFQTREFGRRMLTGRAWV